MTGPNPEGGQNAVSPGRLSARRPDPPSAAPDGTAGNDGDVACRTMEMFNAFGFADRVMKEAYWVNEVTFWKPQDGDGPIMRHGRIRDTEDGLSEFPHVILNQARVHDFYLEAMRHARPGCNRITGCNWPA